MGGWSGGGEQCEGASRFFRSARPDLAPYARRQAPPPRAAAPRDSAWVLCRPRACRPGRGLASPHHLKDVVENPREHEADDESDVADLPVVLRRRSDLDGG